MRHFRSEFIASSGRRQPGAIHDRQEAGKGDDTAIARLEGNFARLNFLITAQ